MAISTSVYDRFNKMSMRNYNNLEKAIAFTGNL